MAARSIYFVMWSASWWQGTTYCNGLRFGSNLCDPHECTCGSLVDCKGSRGLFCRRSFNRSACHSFLNDLIFYVLSGAGITSIKEPAGLSLSNGKRPDGLTLTPGQAGKNANWNVTIPDTLAMSYLNSTSVTADSTVEQASVRKEKKKIRRFGIKSYFYPYCNRKNGSNRFKSIIFSAGVWSSPFRHHW